MSRKITAIVGKLLVLLILLLLWFAFAFACEFMFGVAVVMSVIVISRSSSPQSECVSEFVTRDVGLSLALESLVLVLVLAFPELLFASDSAVGGVACRVFPCGIVLELTMAP